MEQERKNRTKQLLATYYGNSSLKIADGKKDWAYNVAPGLQRAEMLAWELRLPNHQEHEAGGGPLGQLNANGMIIPNKKAQNPAMPFFDFDSASDPRHKFAGGRKHGMFRGTIAETRYHIAFVPAGATKDENGNHIEEGTVNTILYSKGGSSSLQSLMHVLVIPKRCYKQRVFNAVTIPEDYPFEDAMECGRKAIAFLKSSDVPGSLTYWENKYIRIYGSCIPKQFRTVITHTCIFTTMFNKSLPNGRRIAFERRNRKKRSNRLFYAKWLL